MLELLGSLCIRAEVTFWGCRVLQPFCRSAEPVCGQDGQTYSSVCAAYAQRVAVDYPGHCQAVGALSDHGFHSECAFVQCPRLSATGCKPLLAPGEAARGGEGRESSPGPGINGVTLGTKHRL